MSASSTGAVLAALVGNGFLTVIKFIAFAVSGSGAMFSEAVHSLADTANQGLLFIGIRRSEKPANARFRYGYGAERYLFALLSAVGIFVLGCGVTVYHGVHTLLHPGELDLRWWIFAVLGISFVVDGWVLAKALKVVRAQMGEQSLRTYLRTSSDPTAMAVILEDGAACLGVLLALVGIGLAQLTGNPLWDALGSISIGLMLGAIAIFLGLQNRSLIVGRAIPPDVRRTALDFLRSQPSIERVGEVQSRVVGAGVYKLKAEIDFDGRELGREQAGWVEERAPELADRAACEQFAAEFGERMMRGLADEIDRMELELRALHPEFTYLDFEAD